MRQHVALEFGSRVGELTIIGGPYKKYRKSLAQWDYAYICRCSCGAVKEIVAMALRSRVVVSCGCVRRLVTAQLKYKHGEARQGRVSVEFRIWLGIIDRCHNESNRSYARYGGRGIRVCNEWRDDFEAFLKAVGRRPSSAHSLDRFPNNNGNYEPGNFRWATIDQQNRNTRRTVRIDCGSECLCAKDFAREAGIKYTSLTGALRRGERVEDIVRRLKGRGAWRAA